MQVAQRIVRQSWALPPRKGKVATKGTKFTKGIADPFVVLVPLCGQFPFAPDSTPPGPPRASMQAHYSFRQHPDAAGNQKPSGHPPVDPGSESLRHEAPAPQP